MHLVVPLVRMSTAVGEADVGNVLGCTTRRAEKCRIFSHNTYFDTETSFEECGMTIVDDDDASFSKHTGVPILWSVCSLGCLDVAARVEGAFSTNRCLLICCRRNQPGESLDIQTAVGGGDFPLHRPPYRRQAQHACCHRVYLV